MRFVVFWMYKWLMVIKLITANKGEIMISSNEKLLNLLELMQNMLLLFFYFLPSLTKQGTTLLETITFMNLLRFMLMAKDLFLAINFYQL